MKSIPLLNRGRRALALAACTLVAGAAAFAHGTAAAQPAADSYPARPVKVIVPFPAGTSPDIVIRLLSQKLQERLGQPFVIENRAGAGGSIGASAAALAAPDGYTLFFMVNSIVTMNQFIYKKLPYDPVKDFVPVSLVAAVPYVLLAHKDFPAKSLRELIALAKSKPRDINYASMGVGGAGHVIMELMSSEAAIQLMHIPYRADGLAAVAGGQVPLIFQPTTTAVSQIKTGNVIGLATTSPKRLALLPDVPSIAEVLPGFAADGWQGMLAPAGVPAPVIDKLNKALTAILAQPDIVERFSSLGIVPWPSTPQQMQATINADTAKWGKVIKDANIEPQ
ncbi:MAG: Bug family tripartite tricarboxylate transporter substrate binding protein [Burkholderiaceae bacterium]